jgi:zinc-binding alcohol dehydrogenase/oxidoreductase
MRSREPLVEEAAAVPLASVTAYRALVTRGQRASRARTVLITGSAAAWRRAPLRIARTSWGEGIRHLRTRFEDCRARQLGARAASITARTTGRNRSSATSVSHPTSSSTAPVATRSTKSSGRPQAGGRLVSYGSTLGAGAERRECAYLLEAAERARQHDGLAVRTSPRCCSSTNRLKPVIDKVFPLEQAGDAHIRMEAGDQFGKIVTENSAEGSVPSALRSTARK